MSDYKNLSDDEKAKNIFNAFKPFEDMLNVFGKQYSEEMELAAIWLEKPIIYNHKSKHWTCRMAAGDQIRIENGIIVRGTLEDEATHQVISCYGTINSSSLTVQLWNLETNQPEILKLK